MNTTSTQGPHQGFTPDKPAIGTYEQALHHVGRKSARYFADAPISEATVKMFCAMVEDPNPVYWDPATAQRIFGGPIAPPALVQSIFFPLPWRPGGAERPSLAAWAVPLPGRTLINVDSDAVHHRPFFIGDTLSYYDEILSVSPERHTRLGVGHFVTSAFHIEDADERAVSTVVNTMLRFGSEQEPTR